MAPGGIIYLVRHVPTDRVYVGMTVQRLAKRWNGHCKMAREQNPLGYLPRAIKKYGVEQFRIEPILSCLDRAFSPDLERELIAEFGSFERGFNLTIGGDKGAIGHKHSSRTKALISAALKGRVHSAESRARMAAASGNRGIARSAEVRAKIAAGLKSRVRSPEHRANNAAAQRGKPKSAETRAKISAALSGRKHPPELRAKLAAHLRRLRNGKPQIAQGSLF